MSKSDFPFYKTKFNLERDEHSRPDPEGNLYKIKNLTNIETNYKCDFCGTSGTNLEYYNYTLSIFDIYRGGILVKCPKCNKQVHFEITEIS